MGRKARASLSLVKTRDELLSRGVSDPLPIIGLMLGGMGLPSSESDVKAAIAAEERELFGDPAGLVGTVLGLATVEPGAKRHTDVPGTVQANLLLARDALRRAAKQIRFAESAQTRLNEIDPTGLPAARIPRVLRTSKTRVILEEEASGAPLTEELVAEAIAVDFGPLREAVEAALSAIRLHSGPENDAENDGSEEE